MSFEIDLDNATSFAVSLGELPSDGAPVVRMPGDQSGIGDDGPLLRIEPTLGDSWIAMFAAGEGGLSRAFALPDGDSLCVLAGGRGYVGPSAGPNGWREIELWGIRSLAIGEGCVAFGDFTGVAVFGGTEELWRDQVVTDELKLDRIQDGRLHLTGWEPMRSDYVRVEVDLASGKQLRIDY